MTMTTHERNIKYTSSVGPPGELWLRCWPDGITLQLRQKDGLRAIGLSIEDALDLAKRIIEHLGKEVLGDNNSVP